MKIVMAASEVVPFAKTGGLADVVGALPVVLEKLGIEVVIVMPHYKAIADRQFGIEKLRNDISFTTIGRNIKVYFIDHDKYFNRDGLYGTTSGDHRDNLERFSFYCRRTLDLLAEINFHPEIIHCHDWQSALIAVYLKCRYQDRPFYQGIKTLFTIHNIGYQGLFAKEEFPKLGLDWGLFNPEQLEFYGKINFLKGGIIFSDIINTVSPTYSSQIQSSEFGFGLEGVLSKRKDRLFGVLNGLDYSIWNPQTDKFIAKNYSQKNIEDKYANKKDLQACCGLPQRPEVAFVGIVSRLAQQKGFDIFAEAIEDICALKLQLVILGTGEQRYHQLLQASAKKYPRSLSLSLRFDDALAHKIYAGSDIFLMPSKYEPCGLGQLISLRYGTIPLVFKTGGLADTVSSENGFLFSRYLGSELFSCLKKALAAYGKKKEWLALMQRAMAYNFSWEASAEEYLKLYAKAKGCA